MCQCDPTILYKNYLQKKTFYTFIQTFGPLKVESNCLLENLALAIYAQKMLADFQFSFPLCIPND